MTTPTLPGYTPTSMPCSSGQSPISHGRERSRWCGSAGRHRCHYARRWTSRSRGRFTGSGGVSVEFGAGPWASCLPHRIVGCARRICHGAPPTSPRCQSRAQQEPTSCYWARIWRGNKKRPGRAGAELQELCCAIAARPTLSGVTSPLRVGCHSAAASGKRSANESPSGVESFPPPKPESGQREDVGKLRPRGVSVPHTQGLRPNSMRKPDPSVGIRSLATRLLLESRRGTQLRKKLLGAAIAVVGAVTGIAFPAMISASPATAEPLPCIWCDTQNVQLFPSPSGNISCQTSYRRDSSPDSAYCVSFARPQNMSMNAEGVRVCCPFAAVAIVD